MDLTPILDGLAASLPLAKMILQILGTLVLVGSAYVAITPSKSDDAWFAKLEAIPLLGSLLVALQKFSLFQRS